MARRIKVTIKYDAASGLMWAHDVRTAARLTEYAELSYGDTPAARIGAGDDPAEALRTFLDPTVDPATNRIKNPAPNRVVQLVGWVTVPD